MARMTQQWVGKGAIRSNVTAPKFHRRTKKESEKRNENRIEKTNGSVSNVKPLNYLDSFQSHRTCRIKLFHARKLILQHCKPVRLSLRLPSKARSQPLEWPERGSTRVGTGRLPLE
jgi:hypothetical protein